VFIVMQVIIHYLPHQTHQLAVKLVQHQVF